MAKKVSIKKLLKEQDAFFSTTDRIYNFYLENSKRIWIAAACVVLAGIVVLVVSQIRSSAREKASDAYFAAYVENDPDGTLKNMEAVRSKWKGTPSARAAAYAMVDSYVQLGRHEDARNLLTELYDTLPKGEESLRVLVTNYLGGLSEELGDNEAALKYYLESSKLAESAIGAPQAAQPFQAALLSSLGRVYMALGRTDDARDVYIQISGAFPGTMEAFMAENNLRRLDKASSGAAPTADGSQPPSAPEAAGAAAPSSPPEGSAESSGAADPSGSTEEAGSSKPSDTADPPKSSDKSDPPKASDKAESTGSTPSEGASGPSGKGDPAGGASGGKAGK
ncbi:MAG: tetratricopeptide repeat protein [Deltaproteobacteria bacterium]|jgi:tetratricopeptide (TPR) repeat protein|nr:tetratricopeptide repeat protein [Deltaproteobacteria bacterium]